MEYIEGKTELEYKNTCVVFGRFDGLHKGHRALFEKMKEVKSEMNSLVLSFDYAVNNMFEEEKTDVIYGETEKAVLLEKEGIDTFISYPFSEDTAKMEAEDFIQSVLVGQLGAKKIIVGENCRFGYENKGDVKVLASCAGKYGYELIICETVKTADGQVIHGDMVRKELLDGNIHEANELLGHPLMMLGQVVYGKALGRTVSMPTANLQTIENKMLPAQGVYFTIVRIDGKLYYGLTNVGKRPSVDNYEYVTIETFILDFSEDIYGKVLELEFHKYLRAIKKFDSLAEVQEQVAKESQLTREYFAGLGK